jgi:hypothetical protein
LVHRESLKALNFAITITLLSLAVHVYGVIDGKTPDMETPCLWDQLVLALGFVVVLWATFLGWCRIPVGYPAIPFIRKPKPSTDIVLREPPG